MALYYPCDLLGLGKSALLICIPNHGHGYYSNGNQSWDTCLELFFRMVEMVCSITVIKQTFLWNSSRKVLDACSRNVLEQTIRIFLKLF